MGCVGEKNGKRVRGKREGRGVAVFPPSASDGEWGGVEEVRSVRMGVW